MGLTLTAENFLPIFMGIETLKESVSISISVHITR